MLNGLSSFISFFKLFKVSESLIGTSIPEDN